MKLLTTTGPGPSLLRGDGTRPVVVITGASAGVGRATAQVFARTGAHIALIARGRERLDAAAAEVRALGGQALVIPVDVANPDAVDDAAETPLACQEYPWRVPG